MSKILARAPIAVTMVCAAIVFSLGVDLCRAAEGAATAPMPAAGPIPAGQYQLDKSHASLLMRVSHFGFSTYTTRFSRFESQLSFDPNNIPASILVTTIDAASFEMDAAPQLCLDIMLGPQFLDVPKFPTIVFRSDTVRMTGPKTFEISGTLNMRGVARPLVLSAMYNGGYRGIPKADPRARVGFSAHGSFRRSEFGMLAYLPPPETTSGVGDLVEVSIEAEFNGPPLLPSP